jgi:hypothetical protein
MFGISFFELFIFFCFLSSFFMSVLVFAPICFSFSQFQTCFVCRCYFLHLSVSHSITRYQHFHSKLGTQPNFRLNVDIRYPVRLHVRFFTWLPSVSMDTNAREQTIANRCVVYRMLVYNSQTGGEGEREVLLIGSQVPGHCIAKANEMFPWLKERVKSIRKYTRKCHYKFA